MHMFNLWSKTFKGDQLSGNKVRHSFAICIPSCVFIHPGRCLHHKSATCREKSHLKLRNHKALLWRAQYWLSFTIQHTFPRKNSLLFVIWFIWVILVFRKNVVLDSQNCCFNFFFHIIINFDLQHSIWNLGDKAKCNLIAHFQHSQITWYYIILVYYKMKKKKKNQWIYV